jgi:CheY-like chemotaxis protein
MAKLSGLRALVVEDEGTVALLIESMPEELGCKVAASVPTVPKALIASDAQSFDFAVLDVNLNGQLVFPVAEVLRNRQVPFVFWVRTHRAA